MAEIYKGVFEDDKGNRYYAASDTEITYDTAGIPLNNGGDLSEASVNFTVSSSRKALTAKARFKALMGDIAKWLTDLGPAAFYKVADDFTTTAENYLFTARKGKQLKDEVDNLNQNLGGLNFKEEAGKKYVRGADAVWVPLGNKNLVLMDGNDSYAYVGNSNGYYANFVLSNFDFSGFSKISIRNLSSYSYQVTCGPKVFTSDGTYDISDLDQAKLQVFYRGTNNNGNPPIQIRIELIP